jgi:hypothetical protein
MMECALCKSAMDNCMDCDNIDTCHECADGYELTIGGACQKIANTNCAIEYDDGTCAQCNWGWGFDAEDKCTLDCSEIGDLCGDCAMESYDTEEWLSCN